MGCSTWRVINPQLRSCRRRPSAAHAPYSSRAARKAWRSQGDSPMPGTARQSAPSWLLNSRGSGQHRPLASAGMEELG
eukprot:16430212-Heterocapsa_arctica.AAC.2